jgi:hypothetical protein
MLCRDIPLGMSKSSNGMDDVWAMVETMVSPKARSLQCQCNIIYNSEPLGAS